MRLQDLNKGQIIPAAQGVNTFVEPLRKSAAAPAQLQMLPNPGNTTIIQQGSGGSVQGANQFAELANALAPFNQRLSQLVEGGLGMYAKGQYERGQAEAKAENEARRAQVLANQQQLKSGAEWSAEARKMGGKDPEASILMDRINPYRRAGRINALSRLAAGEIGGAILAEYNNTPYSYSFKPEDPRLTKISVTATKKVLDKYGLTDNTAGFIDYVAPEIAQAMDKVRTIHQSDFVQYQKDTIPLTTKAEIKSIYEKAYREGRVEWQEPGGPMQSADRANNANGWRRGVLVNMSTAINRMAGEEGIRGNLTKMTEQVFDDLLKEAGKASDETEFRQLVEQIEVGPPDKDGKRTPAAVFFQKNILDATLYRINYAQQTYGYEELRRKVETRELQDELATVYVENEDPAVRGQKAAEVIDNRLNKKDAQGNPVPSLLTRAEMMKEAEDAAKISQNYVARGKDGDVVEAWLQAQEQAPSSGWNTPAKAREFEQILKNAPEADRAALRRRFAPLAQRKDEENKKWPGALADPIINAKIAANILDNYPKGVNAVAAAAIRGGQPNDVINGITDAKAAQSVALQRAAYRTHVLNRLNELERKKGSALNAAEITGEVQRAVNEYGSKDKNALKQLFPGGLSGGPAPKGTKAEPPTSVQLQQVKPPPGRKAADRIGWQSSQLDNIPNREKVLRDGQPVLDRPSVENEIDRMAGGGQASPAVRRAAKELGITPGKFLMQQADFYPSLQITPAERTKLLKSSREEAAVSRQVANAGNNDYVARFGNFWLNAITGSAPAQAGTLSGQRIAWRGGGRDGGGPFTGDGGDGGPPPPPPPGAFSGGRVTPPDPKAFRGGGASGGGADVPNTWQGVTAAARAAGARFPELVAAQWALESGWGSSLSGRNNLFGQKGKGTVKSTQEEVGGRMVTIQDSFMDFPSRRAAVQHLVNKWHRDLKAGNIEEAAQQLKRMGYATDSQYPTKLIRIVRQGGRR